MTAGVGGAQFTELGQYGTYLCGHEQFCQNYTPGDRQHDASGRKVPTCCEVLTGGTRLIGHALPSNDCCGTKFRIVWIKESSDATNSEQVGYMDCHNVAFFAPLMHEQLISLQGDIGCLVHPIGGRPPMTVSVEADVPRLIARAKDPNLEVSIVTVLARMGTSDTDWLEDFECNDDNINKVRAALPKNVQRRECTCTDECFLRSYSRTGGYAQNSEDEWDY